MSKPSIPKGTRDFLPVEMERRNYIFDTIREAFRKFGFLQIETPAMENISTLLGKYGDEGDKLLFRILNSGNFLDGVSTAEQDVSNVRELTLKIAEKGLRYDLTVPFARFVVIRYSPYGGQTVLSVADTESFISAMRILSAQTRCLMK